MNSFNVCIRDSGRSWGVGFLVLAIIGLFLAGPAAAADYKEALARVLENQKSSSHLGTGAGGEWKRRAFQPKRRRR